MLNSALTCVLCLYVRLRLDWLLERFALVDPGNLVVSYLLSCKLIIVYYYFKFNFEFSVFAVFARLLCQRKFVIQGS